jgi:hypothetical protein
VQAARLSTADSIESPPLPPEPATDTIRRGWHVPVLIASCLLAVGLAAGGWIVSSILKRHPPKRPIAGAQAIADSSKPTPSTKPNEPILLAPASAGVVFCGAETAVLSGELKVQVAAHGEALGWWNTEQDEAAWSFRVLKPGFFRAEVTYSASDEAAGAALTLHLNDRVRRLSLRSTGGLEHFETDSLTMAIERSGRQRLAIRCGPAETGQRLLVRGVRFVPMGADVAP